MSDGKAVKSASTFRMECRVTVDIQAPPEKIWALLTNADGFPSWNSTVTRIEGPIQKGQKLKITVPISTRTFTPKVTELEPNQKMVWSDGAAPMFKGTRTYTLTPKGSATEFDMVEVFAGIMLPMIKGSLPDFGPVFETYAADLKRAAESR